jgi:hypothetical protein
LRYMPPYTTLKKGEYILRQMKDTEKQNGTTVLNKKAQGDIILNKDDITLFFRRSL